MNNDLLKTLKLAEYFNLTIYEDGLEDEVEDGLEDEVKDGFVVEFEDLEFKAQVLAMFLEITNEPREFSKISNANDYDCSYFEYDGNEYLILNDLAAESRFEDYVNVLCEDVLSEIPKHLHSYFDDAMWINDYMKHGYRGDALSTYDGCENEIAFRGETYYIYKIN